MKKAQTVSSFAMTLGLIIVIGVIIIILKQFLFAQAHVAEAETAQYLTDQIRTAIAKAISYPSDAKYIITVPYTEHYILNVTEYDIGLYFPERDIAIKKPLNTPQLNVIGSTVEDSGEIYIYKSSKNIYITSDDFDMGLEEYLKQKEEEGAPVLIG